VRHFYTLDQVADKIPILNGNWFFNRSIAFGWHTGFHDLSHVFGDQLVDFHWVVSLRHPVERLLSAFSVQIDKERLDAQLGPRPRCP